MAEAAVRSYRPEDRARLCEICYACGLMGDSIAPLFGSQQLFTDYWMTYYLECEPESAFVATVDDEPVGYLVGCCDTARFEDVQETMVWPRIWRRLFTGRYGIPLPLARFLWHALRAHMRDQPLKVPPDEYPAHLHMNVDAAYRGQGHGRRLLAAFCDGLRARGVPGVHLLTTNRNTRAIPLYERWGFQLHDHATITLYAPYLEGPVEGLLYVLPITSPVTARVSP